MDIVFFGSSHFAVPALNVLLANKYKISCVVTQPDRYKGRGLSLAGTEIKEAALKSGLKIYQPEDINAPGAIKFLKNLNPGLFVVIAYGQILTQAVLDIPKIFALNLHASLLPKYRGAAPINWALINGEKITGITIIKMSQKLDAGQIIVQDEINIDDEDTAVRLEEKLAKRAADLLLSALKLIAENNYNLTLQDEAKATFAPALKKEDGLIDWNKPAQDIHNLIRGCNSWPGAFTYWNGKILKIFKARVSPQPATRNPQPAEILQVSRLDITVATGKSNLIIAELQMEGRRQMAVREFISGHKISVGDILGKKQLHNI